MTAGHYWRYRKFVRPHLLCALLASALLAGSPAMADDKYTFADLSALERQEGWEELLAHAKDIAPRERNEAWEELVETAAIAQLGARLARGEPEGASLEADHILKEHAFLKRSRAFLDARAKAGLAGALRCFEQRGAGSCVERLAVFVAQDPSNAQLAFDAGKLTRPYMNPVAGISFYEVALARKPKAGLRARICRDEDVIAAAAHALGQPVTYDSAKAGRAVAFGACFEHIRPNLVEMLVKSSGGYTAANACPGLAERKSLTRFQSAYCDDQLAK